MSIDVTARNGPGVVVRLPSKGVCVMPGTRCNTAVVAIKAASAVAVIASRSDHGARPIARRTTCSNLGWSRDDMAGRNGLMTGYCPRAVKNYLAGLRTR